MSGDLHVGTSGWHYPTGASWNGVFYPKPRRRGFDELAFYAQFFNSVEVNTTFYGQPQPAIAAQWVERSPRDFLFSLKLYQQFTHPRLFAARVKADLTKQLGAADLPPGAVEALIEANQADLDAFRRGIEPIAASGKLGALLTQFPTSFHDAPASRLHLAALLRAFHDYPIAVELRHRSWSDAAGDTRALLDAFGATWAWIDEPKFKDSIRQPDPGGPFVYLRLHGRHAKAWWRGSNDERYNYLYSGEELEPIVEQLQGRRGFVALNNHADARSIANALTLQAMLGQAVDADVPETLIEEYPALKGVRTGLRSLDTRRR
jgi:uncharacterized protein YecE (DUF72 family)